MSKVRSKNLLLLLALGLFLALHLISLTIHPFVHSDEAWLASLTRSMLVQRSFAATEDVFRLTSRFPHALKSLFHVIQAPFVALSWTPFAVRLPSLIAGCFCLWLMIRIAQRLGWNPLSRYLAPLFFSLSPAFWTMAHTGRQEIFLVAAMLFSLLLWSSGKYGAWIALPLALGIFIHPNAFVVSLLVDLFDRTSVSLKSKILRLGGFVGVLALAAGVAVVWSSLMDPQFLEHYRDFGNSVGVGVSFTEKLLGLPRFLGKMWRRTAGTYFLPDNRLLWGGALIGLLLSFWSFPLLDSRGRRIFLVLLLSIPALLAATVVVGKFGPPTTGFLAVPASLILAFAFGEALPLVLRRLSANPRWTLVPALMIAGLLAFQTGREVGGSIAREYYRDYRRVWNTLFESTENQGRVLANLNAAFLLDHDRLVPWRDLASLPDGPGTLDQVLRDLDVRYVVVGGDLTLAYQRRPNWDGLYGELRWYSDLRDILESRGTCLGTWDSSVYGMRIVPYMGLEDGGLEFWTLENP